MHFRKLLLVITAVAAVTFSVGLRGQGLIDGIKVTLPEPVTVGDKVLEPGEYEIRRPSSANRDILQIFNKDKMVYETNVLTVPTGPDDKDPKETKVVLHHIGDAYYFDKIWMEDKNYGWEFPLPDRARALQREAALSVPAARYESSAGSQATASGQVAAAPRYEGPGLAAELDAIAAQEDRQAALDADRDKTVIVPSRTARHKSTATAKPRIVIRWPLCSRKRLPSLLHNRMHALASLNRALSGASRRLSPALNEASRSRIISEVRRSPAVSAIRLPTNFLKPPPTGSHLF